MSEITIWDDRGDGGPGECGAMGPGNHWFQDQGGPEAHVGPLCKCGGVAIAPHGRFAEALRLLDALEAMAAETDKSDELHRFVAILYSKKTRWVCESQSFGPKSYGTTPTEAAEKALDRARKGAEDEIREDSTLYVERMFLAEPRTHGELEAIKRGTTETMVKHRADVDPVPPATAKTAERTVVERIDWAHHNWTREPTPTPATPSVPPTQTDPVQPVPPRPWMRCIGFDPTLGPIWTWPRGAEAWVPAGSVCIYRRSYGRSSQNEFGLSDRDRYFAEQQAAIVAMGMEILRVLVNEHIEWSPTDRVDGLVILARKLPTPNQPPMMPPTEALRSSGDRVGHDRECECPGCRADRALWYGTTDREEQRRLRDETGPSAPEPSRSSLEAWGIPEEKTP